MKDKWIYAGLLLIPVVCSLLAAALFILFVLAAMTLGTDEEAPVATGGEISDTGRAEIPQQFIPLYEAAATKYKIPWNLIAAIHRVETRFSTIEPMVSPVGAEGHMQFMPCTWTGWGHPSCGGLGAGQIPNNEKSNPAIIEKYGGYGVDGDNDGQADPWNATDAIFTAANYLARNGASEGDYEKAVFTYNHSTKYVNDVLGFMNSYAAKPDPVILTPGTGGFMRPLDTTVTSRFANRFHPVLKIWRLHGGIDFDCVTGDSIPASKAGTVTYAGWFDSSNPKAGYGLYVWVDHGGGYKTTYAHLSATTVSVGDKVQPGDIVGACGNTGTSTGDHLHFEIFKDGVLTDPAPFLGL